MTPTILPLDDDPFSHDEQWYAIYTRTGPPPIAHRPPTWRATRRRWRPSPQADDWRPNWLTDWLGRSLEEPHG